MQTVLRICRPDADVPIEDPVAVYAEVATHTEGLPGRGGADANVPAACCKREAAREGRGARTRNRQPVGHGKGSGGGDGKGVDAGGVLDVDGAGNLEPSCEDGIPG